jgi:(4S)-4-hydroxy-5-phosphonooxypentane-2,3-dione isomerase
MTMALLAILVEFTVKADAVGRFRELITANATRSLSEEPGCQRFDVLSPADEPTRIVLYEIYDDDGAFERHLATPHYKDFAAAAEPLIETRSIKRLQFVSPSGR